VPGSTKFVAGDGTVIEILHEVTRTTGSEPVGRVADTINKAASTSFESGMHILGAVAKTIAAEIRNVEDGPSALTIEFGLTASSSGDLAVVSAEAGAAITVTMSWSQ
jgi:Trypsin-co-occurring domain 1